MSGSTLVISREKGGIQLRGMESVELCERDPLKEIASVREPTAGRKPNDDNFHEHLQYHR